MSHHYSSLSEVTQGAARSKASVSLDDDAETAATAPRELTIRPRRAGGRAYLAGWDVIHYRWMSIVRSPYDLCVLTRLFDMTHVLNATGFEASIAAICSGKVPGYPYPLPISRSRVALSLAKLKSLGLVHTRPIRGGQVIVFDHERFFTEERVDGFPPDVVTMQMVRRKNGIRPAQPLW